MKGFIRITSAIVMLVFMLAMASPLQAQALRGDFVQVQLKSKAASTAGSGTGSTISRMHNFKDAIILLNFGTITAQNSATLDILIQTSPDSGTTWVDLGAFAQQVGSATTGKSQLMQWTSLSVTTAQRHDLAIINRNLAAGTVQHGPAGPLWRAVWVAADAATGSWVFGITGFFRR